MGWRRPCRHAGGRADSGGDAAVHCAAQAAAEGVHLLQTRCSGRTHKRSGLGRLPQHSHWKCHAPRHLWGPGALFAHATQGYLLCVDKQRTSSNFHCPSTCMYIFWQRGASRRPETYHHCFIHNSYSRGTPHVCVLTQIDCGGPSYEMMHAVPILGYGTGGASQLHYLSLMLTTLVLTVHAGKAHQYWHCHDHQPPGTVPGRAHLWPRLLHIQRGEIDRNSSL